LQSIVTKNELYINVINVLEILQVRLLVMPWNKNFDMENAMQAFWLKGYEATSISDIINATGVQR